jgi:predicted metal-binding membrane protein
MMAILVVVGLMNLLWMAALTTLFVAEKTWRHGVALTRFVGAAVAGLGLLVLVRPGLLEVISR